MNSTENNLPSEQRAQIEETARQLATSTVIPGVTTEMLDTAGEVLDAGLQTLGVVADVAGVAITVVEVAGSVIGAVADAVGNTDLGS
jgi:hypothetical protein